MKTLKFEQTPGDSGGQRSLACYNPWSQSQRVGHSLATEQHPKYIRN